MGPSGRHIRQGASLSTGKQNWASPKKKRCISEHIPDLTLQADTYKRGALVKHSTDFGQIQTYTEKTWCNSEHIEIGTLRQTHQTRCIIERRKTDRRDALASSKTDLGFFRQILADVVH